MMWGDIRLLINGFCSKFGFKLKDYQFPNTLLSNPSFNSLPNNFCSCQSVSTDSKVLGLKYILQRSLFNLKSGRFSLMQKRYSAQNSTAATTIEDDIDYMIAEFVYKFKQPPYSSFLIGALRRYNKPKTYLTNPISVRRCIKHITFSGIVSLLGFGICSCFVGLSHFETIPYTNRKHVLLIPPAEDQNIGSFFFDDSMKEKLSILPDKHPDSIRVRLISSRIIKALKKDLQFKQMNTGRGFESKYNFSNVVGDRRAISLSQQGGAKLSVEHLDGLKWEVYVVNDPTPNAYCLPGRIVMNTGLLRYLTSDVHIATVIGHEVGHVVARHTAEAITHTMWSIVVRTVMRIILGDSASNPKIMMAMEKYLLHCPLSRRGEKEADYIGLLLMATAGYDPEHAINVYKFFDQLSGKKLFSIDSSFLSTHPSGKKRAEALAKVEVMEEAKRRYLQVIKSRYRGNDFRDGVIQFSKRILCIQ